jgi:hypothetical protein
VSDSEGGIKKGIEGGMEGGIKDKVKGGKQNSLLVNATGSPNFCCIWHRGVTTPCG